MCNGEDRTVRDALGNFIVAPWMEVGIIQVIRSDSFTHVSSRLSTFVEPMVFISVPDHGTADLYSGYQSCFRIRNIKNESGNGPVTFEVKMVQPNDSWCNYTWWTPVVESQKNLHYLIIEKGHWNLSGGEFDAHSDRMNAHCTQFSHRHFWYHHFSDINAVPAHFVQHQTYNDPRFVSYRANDHSIINKPITNPLTFKPDSNWNGCTVFIQLHNADTKWHPRLGDCSYGHYMDHYDNNRWRQAYTMDYEYVAILGYLPEYAASCYEGIAFEAHVVDGITSDSRWVPFYWYYELVPAVFGNVNSFVGGDSITVRSFNHTVLGVGVMSQEDQCQKQDGIHNQGERHTFFIIGPNNLTKSGNNPYDQIKRNRFLCQVEYVSPSGRCGDPSTGGTGEQCPSGQCCSHGGYCGTTSNFCDGGFGCQSNYGSCVIPPDLCGAAANGAMCPNGECCSSSGTCGTTSDYCDPNKGCQNAYGSCSPPTGQCGSIASGGNLASCPMGQCCSSFGYCGTTTAYCDINNGCQSSYGSCYYNPTSAPTLPPTPSGRCGDPMTGGTGAHCPAGQCCSHGGYCGTTSNYCDSNLGCQNTYGSCVNTPPVCGAAANGAMCPNGECCSSSGTCGTTSAYCDPNNGCQSGYGSCSPPTGQCGSIASGGNLAGCPMGQCCSSFGYCGTTSAYCDVINGCQSSYGSCNSAPTAAPTSSGRCGDPMTGGTGAHCPAGQCCSHGGYCGTTSNYCDSNLGCQNTYGSCVNTPPVCGAAANGAMCPNGECCSSSGTCGTTSAYCDPNNGCQSGYGSCSPPNGQCGSIASGGNLASCPMGQCCSPFGFCGTTSAYCDIVIGCQSSYGVCYYTPTLFPTPDPTGMPTIAPTRSPTPLPTPDPTGKPTYAPSNIPPVCIMFPMLDQFGDGWDTAHLMLYDSYGLYKTYAPTCTKNPTIAEYCFNLNPCKAGQSSGSSFGNMSLDSSVICGSKDGDFVTASVNGFMPTAPWEVSILCSLFIDCPNTLVVIAVFLFRYFGKLSINKPARPIQADISPK